MSLVQEINVEAMRVALRQFVPEQTLGAIEHLYQLLDQAMKAGHELGVVEGKQDFEAACNDSFDTGWMLGEESGKQEAEANAEDLWDDGYLAGVGDARARPEMADEMVADIILDQFNEEPDAEALYDAALVQDSGDESDGTYCIVCENYDCVDPVQ